MDCNMPIMNGFMTTRAIIDACKEANCEIPYIVALTASDPSRDLIDKCKQSGMQEVRMKPMTFNQLFELFQKHDIYQYLKQDLNNNKF